MKIKTYLLILMTLIIIGGGIYVKDLLGTIQDQENTIAVQIQNKEALQDQLEMKADSLQDYAIFVEDLNTENDILEDKYTLIKSKYNILFDSIKVLNEYAEVDTSGNTIVIRFNGKVGTITYKGNTTYFKATGEGKHSIEIAMDPMSVEVEIYLDKESNLIRTNVRVDGNLIADANTVMDSTLYLLIRNNELDRPGELGFFDRLHFLLGANMNIVKGDAIYVPEKFSLALGMGYQFNKFRIFGKYDVINQEINVGIQYHPSVSDIWKR